jgi:hypothetical protein
LIPGVDKVAARKHAVPRKPSYLLDGRRRERATPEKSYPVGRKEGKGRKKDTDIKLEPRDTDMWHMAFHLHFESIKAEILQSVTRCTVGPLIVEKDCPIWGPSPYSLVGTS